MTLQEENERLRELLREASHCCPDEQLRNEMKALSQQAEPDHVEDMLAMVEPAPAQDERGDELEAIHQYAFEVGGTEGGRYMLEPEELDEVARRACEPFEDVLRSLACSLGAGGYNALTVDPAVFEQKIRWGIDQLTRPAQTEQSGLRAIHAMILNALDRDAAEGKAVRGEMAAELRAALFTQEK